MATDDEVIHACILAKTKVSAPCPKNQTEFYDWLHANITKMYWDCGGYSEGGVSSHELRMRDKYNAGKITFDKCAAGTNNNTGLIIVAAVVGLGILLLFRKR